MPVASAIVSCHEAAGLTAWASVADPSAGQLPATPSTVHGPPCATTRAGRLADGRKPLTTRILMGVAGSTVARVVPW